MRKAITLLFSFLIILLIAGCASAKPSGSIFTNITLPVTVTSSNEKPLKTGSATCKSYLGLVAVGDASIDNAVKKAGITKIHHIEWKSNSILGMIGTYKCVVYGE